MKPEDKIREALAKLDKANDDHWTEDGLPVLEALGGKFTREQVTAAAPKFTRETLDASAAPDPAEEPKDEKPEPEVKPEPAQKETLSEEQLQAMIDEAQGQIEAAEAAKIKAEKDRVEAERRHSDLVKRKDTAFPPPNQAQAFQAWQRSQQEQRLQRHKRIQQAFGGGVKPNEVDPRAPIDRAMARQEGHGRDRPTVPNVPTGKPEGA